MGFLSSIFAKIGEWLLTNIFKRISDYISKEKMEKERKKVDEENSKELKEIIREGKSDEEISQKAEDLLNGLDRD